VEWVARFAVEMVALMPWNTQVFPSRANFDAAFQGGSGLADANFVTLPDGRRPFSGISGERSLPLNMPLSCCPVQHACPRLILP